MAFTYCENCGEKIDDTSKFCPHCGYSKFAQNTGNYGNSQDNYGGEGNGKPYGTQNPYGNQNPYGDQPPYGNRNQYGNRDPYGNQPPYGGNYQRKGEVNVKVLVFALVTLLCFSPIPGIIALYFALTAPNQPNEELKARNDKYSVIASIVGVVISIVFVGLLVVGTILEYINSGMI